jgi:hypothetical protein
VNVYRPTEPIRHGPLWNRAEFLFLGIAVMLLTGVLIPWPDRLMDILWICHLSLTAAVLLTCLFAQNTSQLDGFPALAAAGSFLSFLATAGCMRAIVLRRDTCGRLVRAAGDQIALLEPLLALLLILVIGFFLLYLVLQAARRMRLAVEQYLFQVLPFKQIGLETDQTLQILSAAQSQQLGRKIRKEAAFYASMNGLRKLLTAQISANLFLLLAAWGLAWMGEMLRAAAGHSVSPLEALAPVITGTAVFSWIPPGLTAAACAALLSKESLTLPQQEDKDESAKRKIQILSSVSGRTEEIELLNPDSLFVPPPRIRPAEQIAHFEPPAPASPATAECPLQIIQIRCQNSDQYYLTLENLFAEKSPPASILLLADSVNDLPVTVAVHPAIYLTRKKQRVLLMDADPRNALAQVFNLDPASMMIKPVPVPRISGLWLQKMPDQEKRPEADIQNQEEFTFRIIYAPTQTRLPETLWNNLRSPCKVLFFCINPPAQLHPPTGGWPAGSCLFAVTPLHAAVRPVV